MGKRNMYKYGIMTQGGMNLCHRISLRGVKRILPKLQDEMNDTLVVYRIHEIDSNKVKGE